MGLLCIQPSNVCNFKCKHCPSRKYIKQSLDTSHLLPYLTWINWLIKYIKPEEWIIEVTGGGEPALYPDFYKFIEELADLGYKFMIRSNGSQPIPKHKNVHTITAWHKKWGMTLPKYYDKILILTNPEDKWEEKVQYCKDNSIPYFVGAMKNHSLPAHKREIHFGNGANAKTNGIFKHTWVIYPDGNMRCCNRRIPNGVHPNIKDDTPPVYTPSCPNCPFVFDVETHLTNDMRNHCQKYYQNQLIKKR